MTLLYTHPSGFSHVTPPSHPEQVARLDAVLAALEGMDLERREAPEAAERDILRAHPAGYLALLRRKLPAEGWSMLDSDTYLAPGSLEAARHAAGGACAAVDAVLAGEAPNAFVAMRPPGHHAERMKAMGFCILSSVAIAALRALDHHGLDRVAVLDFDVHHGNGTQDVLWDEKRAFFASTHQVPLYPGTGAASERGAHGQIVNMPLAPGSGGDEARAAWRAICDRVAAWRPQLVLVSAGFDAHADDPLAALMWREADFTAITRMICDTAAGCSAPVVSALEGGYDLAALGRSARAHVDVLRETAA
ncbi:acetoin utilization deacetylase AcuC-like enzyme [Paracoccus pantotrophus]|uniref:Acetoin utilization deacetylase AcuC-like enzyme n=1 Tax=Paracoccus pantotrophus TaxID=82367 RepID=A0AAE6NZH5_PARPN|nr:histone deacetylase family protein [Paracoccus pantotrophus]QFG38283.1 histone deacetylase family protein [Paracoccus pantotrophus]RKS51202.1 acetoin utilization deacetylase AcuC-like enzyme [Paracoccus pantotrophus]